jgi:hypothetical protein
MIITGSSAEGPLGRKHIEPFMKDMVFQASSTIGAHYACLLERTCASGAKASSTDSVLGGVLQS